MNKTRLAALVSGCVLFSNFASAGPLLQFPSGNAAWTVTLTYPDAKATVAPSPQSGGKPAPHPPVVKKAQKVEVTQVDSFKRIRIIWTDKQITERWTVPNLPVVFEEYSNGAVFPLQASQMEMKMDDLNMPHDASAFAWITPSSLQSLTPVSYKGRECFYYRGAASSPSSIMPSTPRAQTIREAWIDSKTLLPVALNTGVSFCVFTFQDTPAAGSLVPPQKFLDQISYYKRVMGVP